MTESLLCAGALRLSHVVFTGRGKLGKETRVKVKIQQLCSTVMLNLVCEVGKGSVLTILNNVMDI